MFRSALQLLILALMLSFPAIGAAQEDAIDPDAATGGLVELTLVNSGAVPVDIIVQLPDQPPTDELGRFAPDAFMEGIEVPAGTRIMAVRAEAATPVLERKPFMTYTTPDAVGPQTVTIPDPRALSPVQLTFVNSAPAPADLFLHDQSVEGGLRKLGTFDVDARKDYPVLPGAQLIARAQDGSITAVYRADLDATQVFDLRAAALPAGKTVPVLIMNMTRFPIAVKQQIPGSLARLAAVPGWHHTTVDAAVGGTLKVETNGAELKLLQSHPVEDVMDQHILVSHDIAQMSAVAKIPAISPQAIPKDLRDSAQGFLETVGMLEKNNPNVTGFVAFNAGDDPVWLARWEEGAISSFRKYDPGRTAHALTRTGTRNVTWPGDIAPEDVRARDLTMVFTTGHSMPRFVDISTPPPARADLVNETCRPLALYQTNAFGNSEFLGRMHPNGDRMEVSARVGTELTARIDAGSTEAGAPLWRGLLSGQASDLLEIGMADETLGDRIVMPRIPEGAEQAPRTVLLTNFTSRPVSVFEIDRTGALKQMFIEGKALELAPGTDHALYRPEGTAMVFRRPNAPVHRAEYGRYRVTAEPNQQVEIGELKQKRTNVTGAWIRQAHAESLPENEVGTRFLTMVAAQDPTRVTGSTNMLDRNNAAAKFEGCSIGGESHGFYYPEGFGLQCDTTRTAPDGSETRSWGRYRMRVTGTKMEMAYGYCDETPNRSSVWSPLPEHFDDMDPDTEGFTHGMMETAWAPPSFEWLGRGFNLLYADPMNYSSTENTRAYSAEPLINFIYRDSRGSVTDSTAMSIFGVEHNNQNAASAECDQTQKVVTNMQDMHDFSQHSYGGSIGVPGIASFSMSKSHEEKNNASTGRETMYVMERCDLRMDELIVNTRWSDQSGYDLMRQPLDAGFRRAVAGLPLKWDGEALKTFIEKYGTHFSERVVYGGTFFAETTVKKETFHRGFEVRDGIGVEASGTVKKVQLGGSYKQEDGNGRNSGDAHANSDYRKWSVGGGGEQVYEAWVSSVAKDHLRAPVQIQFRWIYDLMTPVFFPDDPDIGVKNRLMRVAMKQYFQQFKGVDVTATDITQGLAKRDPRSLCVWIDAMKITTNAADGYGAFGGIITGTFVDESGATIDGQSGRLGLGLRTSAPARPDGYVSYALRQNPVVRFDYEDSAEVGWLSGFCTGPVEEDFVWNGSLCIEGTFHIDDSATNRWTGDCDFSPRLHNLNAVERGMPLVIKDSIETPGNVRLDYEIKVAVE